MITFLNEDGSSGYPNDVVIKKFKSITGIEHRRYAEDHLNSSDLAFMASKKAIENAAIDPETMTILFLPITLET
jgi:3-oxoacyl-[acyl-carrier-protein] synthase-3